MKRQLLTLAASVIATSLLAADASPADAVKSAAKALAAKDNYSWKTTIEFGSNEGTVEGKTEKNGATLLNISGGDQSMDAALKGAKGVMKVEGTWKTLAEAAEEGQQGAARFVSRMLQTFKAPAGEAEEIAGKVKELKLADGVYSGDLTEEGVKSMLSFGRRAGGTPPEVTVAKGSAKFWVKDGALTKYEYKVEGTMTLNGNERDVSRKNTVEIKDVGTTKVSVPEEAAKKLS
jgi:hypothetical protein